MKPGKGTLLDCAVSVTVIYIYIFFAHTEQEGVLILLSMSVNMDTALSKAAQVRINGHPVFLVSFDALTLDCHQLSKPYI